MKLIVSIAVAFLCLSIAVADDEVENQPLFQIIASDTCISGYFLTPISLNPFDQTYDIKFNLPDTSYVSIFITDTLGIDTVWCTQRKILSPGYYRILHDPIMEVLVSLKIQHGDLHFMAERYYSSYLGDMEYQFIATGRL
ncbi:MAG: hypothetical protein R3F48_17060 [Candidatus Zixiibacteriota bacterium]